MKDRNLRQSFLGEDSDDLLHNFKVALVGLGGGGSHVGQQLAHAGVGNFVTADGDIVEDKNLNRLIGATAQDVIDELPKGEIARRLIAGINPKASIVHIPGNWQDDAAKLRDRHVVLAGIDGFAARAELEAYCRRFLIPLIDIGMDVHAHAGRFHIAGQVILSMPGSHCMRCMGFITDERLSREAQLYGAAGGRPQVVWPNGVLASAAVGISIGLATAWSNVRPSAYLEYDGDQHSLRPSNIMKIIANRPCRHYERDAVGDPFFARRSRDGGRDWLDDDIEQAA